MIMVVRLQFLAGWVLCLFDGGPVLVTLTLFTNSTVSFPTCRVVPCGWNSNWVLPRVAACWRKPPPKFTSSENPRMTVAQTRKTLEIPSRRMLNFLVRPRVVMLRPWPAVPTLRRLIVAYLSPKRLKKDSDIPTPVVRRLPLSIINLVCCCQPVMSSVALPYINA